MNNDELMVLEELRKILVEDNPMKKDIVSLYDLAQLMTLKYNEYNTLLRRYQDYLEEKYNSEIITLCNFNYKKEAIVLEIKSKKDANSQLVAFTKQNNNFVFQSKNGDFNKILNLLKKDLIIMYNEFMKFYELMTDEIYFRKTKNSKFEFTLYNSCIFISYKNHMGLLEDFDLTYYTKNGYYEYYNKSKDISNIIVGNENQIFKNIFINIKDCPKWSRNILYDFKDMQLKNEKTKNLKIN